MSFVLFAFCSCIFLLFGFVGFSCIFSNNLSGANYLLNRIAIRARTNHLLFSVGQKDITVAYNYFDELGTYS